jgi:hypothetical protein
VVVSRFVLLETESIELGIRLSKQKMEREKLEKLRRKEDKAKAEAAKRAAAAARGDTKVNI